MYEKILSDVDVQMKPGLNLLRDQVAIFKQHVHSPWPGHSCILDLDINDINML